MAHVYFLIPGLIAGPQSRSSIAQDSLQPLKKTLGRLTQEPVIQPLGTPAFASSVHLSWLWSVLTRRPLPFARAAYAWAVQNGPMLTGDIWSLTLCVHSEEGTLSRAPLSQSQTEAACAALTPVLQKAGFVLQRWDPHLYLTRKKPLKAAAAPFEVVSLRKGALSQSIEGEEKDALFSLRAECEAALAAVSSPAQSVWISAGGGSFDYVYPPTKIRSVLTDSETVRGWALAAGILLQRIGRVGDNALWPEDAPQGECIAVIEDLYEPWLAENWSLWAQRLAGVCAKIEALSAAARKKGCDKALIVGTGLGFTVTCEKRLSGARSLLARLTAKEADCAGIVFAEAGL